MSDIIPVRQRPAAFKTDEIKDLQRELEDCVNHLFNIYYFVQIEIPADVHEKYVPHYYLHTEVYYGIDREPYKYVTYVNPRLLEILSVEELKALVISEASALKFKEQGLKRSSDSCMSLVIDRYSIQLGAEPVYIANVIYKLKECWIDDEEPDKIPDDIRERLIMLRYLNK